MAALMRSNRSQRIVFPGFPPRANQRGRRGKSVDEVTVGWDCLFPFFVAFLEEDGEG